MAVIIALVLVNNVSDAEEKRFSVEFINRCCTGFIVHRLAFHLMFIVNIDVLRSFNFAVSLWYTMLLLLSSIYGVITIETAMDIATPPQFKELSMNYVFSRFTDSA